MQEAKFNAIVTCVSLFYYLYLHKRQQKDNPQKNILVALFTYRFFSFYSIFSPASGYHKSSTKEMCNNLSITHFPHH